MKPRESVMWFAEQMEHNLRANDYKGGWGGCSFSYLLAGIDREIKELRREFELRSSREGYQSKSTQRVISEAADVANFAMMIADNARKKK